ncbi:MAG: tetratricopeptide repeat protein [Gemmatimonadaceae bacterium]|nr:tetratricopeptide repeat protein [Gemmatimonadaceae bacterium]
MHADPSRLATARAEAARVAALGAWGDVAGLLQPYRAQLGAHPESAALLGEALVRTGRSAEAREWLASVLPTLETAGDRASLRRATVLLGASYFELGVLEEARRAFTEALDLARRDGDDALVARAMNNLGAIANVEGDWGSAIGLYTLAVSAHQRRGDVRGLAETFHNMAITARDQGRLAEADELEQRCVEYARAAQRPLLVSIARLGRAELAFRRGDAPLAEASARRVAKEFADAGDPVREAESLRLAGVACTASGKHADARALLDHAVERARTHGAVLLAAEALRARAELRAAVADPHGALDDARAALALFTQLNARHDAAAMLRFIETLAV